MDPLEWIAMRGVANSWLEVLLGLQSRLIHNIHILRFMFVGCLLRFLFASRCSQPTVQGDQDRGHRCYHASPAKRRRDARRKAAFIATKRQVCIATDEDDDFYDASPDGADCHASNEKCWHSLDDPRAESFLLSLGGRPLLAWDYLGTAADTAEDAHSFYTCLSVADGGAIVLPMGLNRHALFGLVRDGMLSVRCVENDRLKFNVKAGARRCFLSMQLCSIIQWHQRLRTLLKAFNVQVPRLTMRMLTTYESETLTRIVGMSLSMARDIDSTLDVNLSRLFCRDLTRDVSLYARRAWEAIVVGLQRQDRSAIGWARLYWRALNDESKLTVNAMRSHRTWCLLGQLVDCVWSAPGELGRLSNSLHEPAYDRARQRDIYPLPLVSLAQVETGFNCAGEVLPAAHRYINAVIVVLNFTYGVRAPVHLPRSRKLPKTQATVVARVIESCRQLAERLNTSLPPSFSYGDKDAWSCFEHGGMSKSVPLVASKVDNLVKAGSCDPLPLLPEHIVDQICSDDALFPDVPKGLHKFSEFRAGERLEYVRLVVAQLRCGKTVLADHVRGGGTVFAVAKGDGSRQREVWHGARVSAAAICPPRPRHLASPSAFKAFDLDHGRSLRVTKRDGRCFFDQLLLPSSLCPYMGRPSVRIAELIAEGMSHEEIISFSSRDRPRTWRAMAFIPCLGNGLLLVKLYCTGDTFESMFQSRPCGGCYSINRRCGSNGLS